ncbi:MAG: tetratricopeptide repeat protein [Gelidibacter sp.]
MKAKRLPFLFFLNITLMFGVLEIPQSSAQKMEDSVKYYYYLFVNPQKSSDLTQAYQFYQRHLKYNLHKKDTVSAINDLRYMASIQNNLGLFYDSEKTVVQALKLLDQQHQKDSTNAKLGLYNQLGMIHRSLYNYDKAIEFYLSALKTSTTSRDSMTILNNIAYTHSAQGKHNLAQIEFEKVYMNSLKEHDKEAMARALSNLGHEQAKLNHPQSLSNMLKALEMRKEINDIKGIYGSYKHLTEYYDDINNKEKSQYYAEEAYKLAKSLNSLSFLKDALSNLLELKDDPLVKEYKTIIDSIAKSKQLQENKFAEMQYTYTEYQRKAQESQLAASEQRSKTLASQFAVLSILLMAIFFYIILRTRHKKEKMLKVYETETRISKKVHDEVANDIYQMMSKLQSSHRVDEPFLDELEDIYIKTRDISKENSDIIQEDFALQLQDLLASYQNEDVNVITKDINSIHWKNLPDVKKTTLYRVLQELMTNMKKHSQASLVVITFKQEKQKLQIVYKDNGVGTDLHKGNGCHNMENRMDSIKGMIIFESEPEKGFKASLTV